MVTTAPGVRARASTSARAGPRVKSPVGWISVERDSNGVIHAEFESILQEPAGRRVGAASRSKVMPDRELQQVANAIQALFAGNARPAKSVPTPSGSPFHRKCWDACRSIPRGQTRTYAWLAEQAGSPKAIRAAGQAMRRNPLPIIIPCHRVVAASGVGGFAGAAEPECARVRLKQQLLELERA
ncbi:MAG: methylated-DNA--[protein]-cysteine S-methyltransferase [Planctomycetota bacterium]|nr:methylated-DNA--[protein]-cysteine S-methyltransferase [Planctomycetota bacterium]MDA1105312.1 methylated-DNA--[protein]-cysteine S-methyltransferase [Planctomycetota bacterium]